MIDVKKPLMAPGRIVATPAALELLQAAGLRPSELLDRHVYGDWGDLCDEDKALNDEAVRDGSRILSSYEIGDEKLWIISEAANDDGERYATTLLLDFEY